MILAKVEKNKSCLCEMVTKLRHRQHADKKKGIENIPSDFEKHLCWSESVHDMMHV